MARRGEPTVAPTPRRLLEARRRGEVAFSRHLTSAAALAAAVGALTWAGPALLAELVAYQRGAMLAAVTGGGAGQALAAAVAVGARALALPLGLAAGVALAVGAAQTRGLVAPAAVAPDVERLFGRRGSGRAADLGWALAHGGLALAVAWATLRPSLGGVVGLLGAPDAAGRTLGAMGTLGRALAGRLALLGLALGVGDYLVRLARHRRALRMTPEEAERDRRETEGHPEHRAERRRLHRALSERREQQMTGDVRKADVVLIVAPAVAVALRYAPPLAAAPVVIARAERLGAQRLEDVAREAGVPIVSDPPGALAGLAQLYVGDEIPPALYQAVAEILRVVGVRAT